MYLNVDYLKLIVRDVMVFFQYRVIQKSEETLRSEERTRRRQTFYSPWRKPLERQQRLVLLQGYYSAAKD